MHTLSTYYKNTLCSITACACSLLFICTHAAAAPTDNDTPPTPRSSWDSLSELATSVVISIPASILIIASVMTGQSEPMHIEDLLQNEEQVTIQDITPLSDDTQRWTLQRGSDQKTISFEVKGSHVRSPDGYPLHTPISVSTERYGIMLHQNNQVIAFFINQAGIEKFGIML